MKHEMLRDMKGTRSGAGIWESATVEVLSVCHA